MNKRLLGALLCVLVLFGTVLGSPAAVHGAPEEGTETAVHAGRIALEQTVIDFAAASETGSPAIIAGEQIAAVAQGEDGVSFTPTGGQAGVRYAVRIPFEQISFFDSEKAALIFTLTDAAGAYTHYRLEWRFYSGAHVSAFTATVHGGGTYTMIAPVGADPYRSSYTWAEFAVTPEGDGTDAVFAGGTLVSLTADGALDTTRHTRYLTDAVTTEGCTAAFTEAGIAVSAIEAGGAIAFDVHVEDRLALASYNAVRLTVENPAGLDMLRLQYKRAGEDDFAGAPVEKALFSDVRARSYLFRTGTLDELLSLRILFPAACDGLTVTGVSLERMPEERGGIGHLSVCEVREEKLILGGTMTTDDTLAYLGMDMGLYRIDIGADADACDYAAPIDTTAVSTRFEFRIDTEKLEKFRESAYFVAIVSESGPVLVTSPASPAKYGQAAHTLTFSQHDKCAAVNDLSLLDAGMASVIVDISMERLWSDGAGDLYLHGGEQYVFDTAYLRERGALIRAYSALGTSVLVRLVSQDGAYFFDRTNLPALYAAVDFLSARYCTGPEGVISGFIVGDRANASAACAELGLFESARRYGDAVRTVANAAGVTFANARVYLAVTLAETSAEDAFLFAEETLLSLKRSSAIDCYLFAEAPAASDASLISEFAVRVSKSVGTGFLGATVMLSAPAFPEAEYLALLEQTKNLRYLEMAAITADGSGAMRAWLKTSDAADRVYAEFQMMVPEGTRGSYTYADLSEGYGTGPLSAGYGCTELSRQTGADGVRAVSAALPEGGILLVDLSAFDFTKTETVALDLAVTRGFEGALVLVGAGGQAEYRFTAATGETVTLAADTSLAGIGKVTAAYLRADSPSGGAFSVRTVRGLSRTLTDAELAASFDNGETDGAAWKTTGIAAVIIAVSATVAAVAFLARRENRKRDED